MFMHKQGLREAKRGCVCGGGVALLLPACMRCGGGG